MQEVGKFELNQDGWYVCQCDFKYTYNGESHTSQHTPNQTKGNTYYMDPGDYAVPDGATVQLKLCVTAGKDVTADEKFIYKKGSNTTAVYTSSGSTIDPHLKFNGLKQ